MYKVVLEVVRVPKQCAAGFEVGDKMVIEDPKIVLNETSNVCLYALSSLMPYLISLTRELPKDDWMNQVNELCCSDPHNPVKFKVTRIPI